MPPDAARKRLQIVHLAWLALGLASALAGGIAGAAAQAVVAAAALTLVSGIAGYALSGAGDSLSRGSLVIAWLVPALAAIVLTGGGVSPLIILLLMAPLAALLAGARRMAAEAGIFAALALFAVTAATQVGAIPPPSPEAARLAPAFAFAGAVAAALTVWQLVRPHAMPAAAVPEAAPAPDPPAAEFPPTAMPGLVWLDISAEGRVRRVHGDALGLATMKPGAAFAALFRRLPEGLPPPDGAQRRFAAAELATGRPVRLMAARHARGWQMLIADAAGEPQSEAGAIAALEEKLKARTAFFASLGHELKTPLNAILGYAEMMQAGVFGPLPQPYADYPAIIHESGTDLLLLVDDILDLARSEAGKPRLEPEPVDLTASAESVIRQLAGQAARSGVTLRLRTETEVWAEADARAVRQIWQNLLSNAIKYSERGQSVMLDTRMLDGAAVLSVTDRGAGIPAADLARLTEPFAQASGARAGTGLGLAVVRRFAEMHGGRLEIASKPGRGTRVTVTLPRAAEADIAPGEEAAE